MKEMRKAVSVAVGLVLVFGSGCHHDLTGKGPGAGHHYGQKDDREFEVYIYTDPNNSSQCLLDWGVGTLWKNKHQTATWFSDDNKQYTVDFTKGNHAPDKSPFQSDMFAVPAVSRKADHYSRTPTDITTSPSLTRRTSNARTRVILDIT
jgi:hypothetical protein